MKVTEHLARASAPLISFEILPPLRGGNIRALLALMDELIKFKPPFIDITSHAAEVMYEETPAGIRRRVKRKRPGTLGICALIQNKYDVDAVPHVICRGFTREETEDFLIELRFLAIDNVLAIQGDGGAYDKPLRDGKTANRFALDLVEQITAMNRGQYLEVDLLNAEATEFCVGIAGYPEKHFEAPNLAADIKHAKAKVDAGADYIVTQMFYDNAKYFAFVDACRAAGIAVPIIPGLKILTSAKQLTAVPRTFFVDIPAALSDEVMKNPAHAEAIGIEWAARQSAELLNAKVPSLHFYVMQNAGAVTKLIDKLQR